DGRRGRGGIDCYGRRGVLGHGRTGVVTPHALHVLLESSRLRGLAPRAMHPKRLAALGLRLVGHRGGRTVPYRNVREARTFELALDHARACKRLEARQYELREVLCAVVKGDCLRSDLGKGHGS